MMLLKILTKYINNAESKSLEDQFNAWSEGNPELTIHQVQFFSFNKISADNSVEKQLICCSVLYFPKSST
jgi:hypothetical protein